MTRDLQSIFCFVCGAKSFISSEQVQRKVTYIIKRFKGKDQKRQGEHFQKYASNLTINPHIYNLILQTISSTTIPN